MIAKHMTIQIRMSKSMQEFLAASLDLLQAIEHADPVLVTDEISQAAAALWAVVDRNRGEL